MWNPTYSVASVTVPLPVLCDFALPVSNYLPWRFHLPIRPYVETPQVALPHSLLLQFGQPASRFAVYPLASFGRLGL